MPLTAPPDNTKSYLVLAAGVSLGITLFFLTRSTLPSVGDNIHALPHGGAYRDGTKQIIYGGPARTFPSSNVLKPSNSGFAFILALCIIVLLHLLGSGRKLTCMKCGAAH
ncbi:MAG: triple gene block protein 2 [Beijing sediment betaflexivirus]|nr:MAG: triple gene block protein 2 [Beijing sediment betaflexivirus]